MTPVCDRYAEALFKSAQNLKCADAVADELSAVEEALMKSIGYLSSPLISAMDKSALLRTLLEGKIRPLTLEFVLLITARRHIKHFRSIYERYMQLCGRGEAVVSLRVPFIPGPDLLSRLKARFLKDKLIPKNVKDTRIDVIEDKGLIGGFVASCNGYQIDTSLKTALAKLPRAAYFN